MGPQGTRSGPNAENNNLTITFFPKSDFSGILSKKVEKYLIV